MADIHMHRHTTTTPPPAVTPPGTTTTPQPATPSLGSYGNASIDQWDEEFLEASAAVLRKKGVRVDPLFMKAVMEIESGGNGNYPASRCRPSDGTDSVPACGPMQIKQRYHQDRCPECDFSTVAGQIELATHIIGDTMKHYGLDEEHALLKAYFNADDVNGTTQGAYIAKVRSLIATMKGTTPAPKPVVTEKSVLRLIAGPDAYVGFGFNLPNLSCGGPCHFYEYGVGHGTNADYMHPGIDITVPRGTPIHTPLAGRVTCVGTVGEVIWDQGCGFFTDTGGGVGNITVMTDAGVKLTFGHCSKALVRYNQRVQAGEQIALSGTNRADHCHLDVVTNRNGSRWLNDPLPMLVSVMGGTVTPSYDTKRLPVPQPDDDPPYWVVKVTADSVKVLQYGGAQSPEVAPPLVKGETFHATYRLPGLDGKGYWVSTKLGRVPVAGTEETGVVPA